MSEWLPFVGFVKRVLYTGGRDSLDNFFLCTEDWRLLSMKNYTKKSKGIILQRATNVSASVTKVDDFSYRFTVRFRHLLPFGDFGMFKYEDYAVFLIKAMHDTNFISETESSTENTKYLQGQCYLFGHLGMYNNIAVKPVECRLPNLYDVEYSGVQLLRECKKIEQVLISEIWE